MKAKKWTDTRAKKWVRKRDATTRAADERDARAMAERVFESEKRWRPDTARATAEASYRLDKRISSRVDKHPRQPRRKTDSSWNLRRANVGRDKRTGRFVKRKVGR